MKEIIAYEVPGSIVTTEHCKKCEKTTKHFIVSLKTEHEPSGYKIVYTMRCECGNEKEVHGVQIKSN